MVSIFNVLDNVSSQKAGLGVLCLLAETVCEGREGTGADWGERRGLVDFGKDAEHAPCWTRSVWWVSAGSAFVSPRVSFLRGGRWRLLEGGASCRMV